MRYLPVFLDLAGRDVILVGASEPALNKLRLLTSAGARVRWYRGAGNEPAPDLPAGAQVSLESGDPLWADLFGAAAIVSAAGSPLDDAMAQRARTARIPVNVVDRIDLSTFIFGPSSIAATWWSRSEPEARHRFWHDGYASASRRCCPTASAILPR